MAAVFDAFFRREVPYSTQALVDEVDHAGFGGARRVVAGEDLRALVEAAVGEQVRRRLEQLLAAGERCSRGHRHQASP